MIIKDIPEDVMDYIFQAKQAHEAPQAFIIRILREAKDDEGKKDGKKT